METFLVPSNVPHVASSPSLEPQKVKAGIDFSEHQVQLFHFTGEETEAQGGK